MRVATDPHGDSMSDKQAPDPHSAKAAAQAVDAGLRLHQTGQLDAAATHYRRALQAAPNHADALYLLGRVEHQLGHFDAAADLLRKAIQVDPREATFHNNLGEALRAAGNLTAAVAAYRAALEFQPAYALAQHNLALALHGLGDVAASEAAFRAALQLNPDFAEALHNFGVFLREQNRPADAIDAWQRAATIRPIDPSLQFRLGNALWQSGCVEEAGAAFAQVVTLEPNHSAAHLNLGVIHHQRQSLDEAVQHTELALSLRPDWALAHGYLASYLHARGEIEAAMPHYTRAVEISPDDLTLHGNLAHAMNYVPGLDAQSIFEEHVRWAKRHTDPLKPEAIDRLIDRSPNRRLRVGYVSPYFREHSVSVFTEPLLAVHDHEAFEIVCYSDVPTPDEATERFRAAADVWHETAGWSDATLAKRIAADRIDILVDLTGYLAGNRLLAFARRPAPIQVTYIGYQNTTGMAAMDYRLTDAHADPPGPADRLHTERLVRLPDTFFCYRPMPEAPHANSLPAATTGQVTFASFNKYPKVNSAVLDAWARVLAAVPDARMLILENVTDAMRRRTLDAFAAAGVAAERVRFEPKRSRAEYLRLHHEVDVALDAFPFNGHTTTCESLWMGVPVVMLEGSTYVTRFGGTALRHVGCDDLIATSIDQYVETAVRLAGDVARLTELRGTLRARMAASPLLDHRRFARNVETAYRQMWQDFCRT